MREEGVPQTAVQWLAFVQAFLSAYEQGESLSGRLSAPSEPGRASTLPLGSTEGRPVVLLCSPHPDDETLTGALPLRLLREQGARVINLALTLGSNQARQAERWAELLAACAVLGFECQRLPTGSDFDLKSGPAAQGWQTAVQAMADCFGVWRPDYVFYPHDEDRHLAHVAASRLVTAALALWTRSGQRTVSVETEYWHSMSAPNLLVGLSIEDEARLLAALACHRGEIARNPYHLTHPARLMDTVRRGAELVRSSRAARPGFFLGELYRLSVWREGRRQALDLEQAWLGPEHDLAAIVSAGRVD